MHLQVLHECSGELLSIWVLLIWEIGSDKVPEAD